MVRVEGAAPSKTGFFSRTTRAEEAQGGKLRPRGDWNGTSVMLESKPSRGVDLERLSLIYSQASLQAWSCPPWSRSHPSQF